MEGQITYQVDTTKTNSLLPQTSEKSLSVGRSTIASIKTERDTSKQAVQQKKTYTPQQIRHWRWLREQKMLIDSSRYIKPRATTELTTTQIQQLPQMVLPMRERKPYSTDWITVVLFVTIILFATIRYSYFKYIANLFISLFNYATSVRMWNEKNYPASHGAYRLDAIFIITLSLFIFQALSLFKWKQSPQGLLTYFIILGCVGAYYFGKKLCYKIIGSLFQNQAETSEYLFNLDNFNRITGILLLPITILIAFAPFENPSFILFFGLFIFLSFNIVLLKRGMLILLKKHFSIFYLFLYLCTLEFLPLLLIYKVVVE